ncbi:Xenobiotic-transporting ATPase [Syntrophobotulus glycolicus DSM 8271]|uniref:Xenobiotic-transporting ATPase n=1 Tax=Syntrophobotulus glycolicus (strain DSM 8271 / FlGlyR) TaxID=645991 RepID=F0T2L9_SYNGF|nr:ABC transporter ATP-binding protein [Syntrophobotulus glycolicus]ADY56418.1 Xenobiotic-transporting ATPase [Syntrophobotulus glycolicus DSM 8271]
MEAKRENAFKRLLLFASQCRKKMILSAIFAVLGVGCGMIPYFAAASITIKIVDKDYTFMELLMIVLIALAGYTGKVVFHGISTTLSHQSAFTILKNIRSELVKKLSKLPLGDVMEIPSGELKTTIVDTVEKMEQPLAHIIPEMTSNVLISVCVFLYLFYLDMRIALISLITIPIGLIFYKLLMKKYVYSYQKRVEAENVMNATVVEYISGIEAIKAFNQSARSYEKYTNSVNHNCSAVTSFFQNTLFLYSAVMYTMPATLLFVLPFGLYFYMDGTLTLATFISCLVLSFGLVGPLIQAMNLTDGIASLGTMIGQIGEILEANELNRPSDDKTLKNDIIKFEDVSFGYDDKEILHGISFETIPQGMTAIVGPSGSGKSTVAKLMASFWEAKSGQITLGNVDVKELPLSQISDIISYVSQDNFLFNMSVKENIRIGKKDATNEEVIEAAKEASCHDFILSLEHGYDTLAGEAGNHLSGGEKQRISIARAMIKNSPIIVLDEATAYTDPENEAIIQESISRLVKGKSLIVIAHRLSTIISADNIIVMNQGEIAAQGTHQELLEKCKGYQNMWEAHIGTRDRDLKQGGKNNG